MPASRPKRKRIRTVIIAVFAWRDRSYPGFAATVLFAIIGFVLFWDVLNK